MTCFASGKALIVGGYLVLDPQYSGLVIATSAKFKTKTECGLHLNQIQVNSPQFTDGSWTYFVDAESGHLSQT